MPLRPRFRRVAALERRFVNRESVRAAFAEELSRVADQPRVLNVVGVGGIGKSRLVRELRNRAAASQGCRTAVLDLQVPAMRQQENALAVLRTEFGRQQVCFDRFDIAYAVLSQRLHPNLRITGRDLPFLAESEVLTTIARCGRVTARATLILLHRCLLSNLRRSLVARWVAGRRRSRSSPRG